MKSNLLFPLLLFMLLSCQSKKEEFVCTPCDLSCDELTFSEPGTCPHCNMELIKKSELAPERKARVNVLNIQKGSGKFIIEGGFKKEKTIAVHYYKPTHFATSSNMIMVIPGAGRNGDDYRDAWIEKAEQYNLLVLSPEYSEEYYPEFWSYNLAGMITDVKINQERTAMIGFSVNHNHEQWIYNDFDRIFDLVKEKLHLDTDTYDMFGHSAGGQILHRLAIFKPENKANRILASNSGWYTVPTDRVEFPYGLKNGVTSAIDTDFSSNLILFLGEKDDANETRGDLRHTPEMDQQGLFRFERGKYFYSTSKEIATQLGKEFGWKIEVVPNVGHDYKKMSSAAADFLYKTEK